MDNQLISTITIEATKFLFNEASTWLSTLRDRKLIHNLPSAVKKTSANVHEAPLRRADIPTLEKGGLLTFMNESVASTNAYTIKGLTEQLRIHHKNFLDLEATEAEYGSLTPQHVKRSMEREAKALETKVDRLKSLLEQVYGKTIEHVE
jgi:hypothetical protein